MNPPAADKPAAAPKNVPAGLNAAQRDALASHLQSPAMGGRAMDLHMLQGLCAALALGPRTIMPSLWLPWVWDCEQGARAPAFTDIDHADAMLAPVMLVHNDAAARWGPAAADAGPAYEPLFASAAPPAAARFCAGFRSAVALAPDDWAPLWAEWPAWRALLEAAEPDAAAVHALLAPMRQYWRGRLDRLEPLRSGDILNRLRDAFEFIRPPFPRAAVALAEQHRDIAAPWLVQVLEDLARNSGLADDPDYGLHNFAMVLLGHWRDTRAWRPLLALARLPYETVDSIFGDLLFETYNRALASVCDGDIAPLARMAADDAVNVWVRMALLEAWTLRVVEGDAPAAPLEDCLLTLGERDAARLRRGDGADDASPHIIDAVAGCACDIASERLRAPVLGWFAEKLIDTQSIDRDWFEREMAQPLAHKREDRRAHGRSYLRHAEAEIGWWAVYQDDAQQRAVPPAGTIVRSGPKIGRNDPCPCGSGRKYKKCHGAT